MSITTYNGLNQPQSASTDAPAARSAPAPKEWLEEAKRLVSDLGDARVMCSRGRATLDDVNERYQALLSHLRSVPAPQQVELSEEEIDFIAADGMRNAAGGIYATRVYEFARAIASAIKQKGEQG